MTLNVNPNEWMLEQKYRPSTLDECILPKLDRERFTGIVAAKRIPHILLCSKSPGTGKTTMARVLVNEIDAELFFISGGNMRIDTLRTDLTKFASTMSSKPGGKVIIIDEADNPGMRAVHAELRSWMEAYSSNCSLIMTCNNAEVIPDALKSRCRVVEFGNPTAEDKQKMMVEMIKRCIKICELEGVELDEQTGKKAIAALVKKNFPDLRGTITELDSYAKSGRIDEGILVHSTQATDALSDLIVSMRGKKLGEVRALVPKFTADYTAFITKLYDRMFNEIDPKTYRIMIKLIAENQKYHQNVPNLEIHIFDLLADLSCEVSWK